MKTLKNILKSKTIQLSVATMVLGGLQAAQTLQLTPTAMGYVTAGVGVLGFIIRLLTNKPVINTFEG